MASNPTDETSDNSLGAQSSEPLAEQNIAISPLLDNIVGGASRFTSADGDQPVATDGNKKDESVSPEIPQKHSALTVSADPRGPSSMGLKNGESKPSQTLAEQYGTAGLLAELNALAETQQFHLEQHREYVLRSRAEQSQQIDNWRTRCAALEQQLQEARTRVSILEQKHLESQAQVLPLTAQCDAAQAQTERLQTEILERRQRQAEVEAQLELADDTMHEQQKITAAQAQGLVAMQAELSKAQAEVAELETRFSHQLQLRKQLREEGDRDRQGRSKARDRQLQLEQETTQMTGQLLRLGEELRQSQHQSTQWRRQAQEQEQTLRGIAQWAAQAESVPPELMELLAPLFHNPEETVDSGPISPEESTLQRAVDSSNASSVQPAHPSSLDLPSFPNSSQ